MMAMMKLNFTRMMIFIENYNAQIKYGPRRSPKHPCRNCMKIPCKYHIHQYRKRQIRFIAAAVIYIAMIVLIRWKCPLCGATFTEYPSFLLPYKRFIVFDIKRLCQTYLEKDSASYQDIASHEGEQITYHGTDNEREFSPSTVWKWMGF